MTKILANQTNTGSIVASGDITTSGGKLAVTTSSGDEGGEIFLNKSVTNTTITDGVTLDVFQNKLRFFEQGGSNRGFYLDITTGGNGAGTNLGNAVIADGSVTTTKIADGNVTNVKLANSSITVNGTSVSLGGSVTVPVGLSLRSGAAYRPLGPTSTSSSPTGGTLYFAPFIVPNSVTADRLLLRATGGSGTITVRLGIYADNNGMPGSLVVDGGTVSVTSTNTTYSITINTSLSAGVYWTALVPSSQSFNLFAITDSYVNGVQAIGTGTTPHVANFFYSQASAGTGALPSTGASAVASSGSCFIPLVRIA